MRLYSDRKLDLKATVFLATQRHGQWIHILLFAFRSLAIIELEHTLQHTPRDLSCALRSLLTRQASACKLHAEGSFCHRVKRLFSWEEWHYTRSATRSIDESSYKSSNVVCTTTTSSKQTDSLSTHHVSTQGRRSDTET